MPLYKSSAIKANDNRVIVVHNETIQLMTMVALILKYIKGGISLISQEMILHSVFQYGSSVQVKWSHALS